MRNMSFAMTTTQIRNRTKTVTRRFGWWFLKPGDRVQAVAKCQGLKKGEKVERLAVLKIVSVHKEQLRDIYWQDCVAEGFPELKPIQYIDMMAQKFNTRLTDDVNRIEFKYVLNGE